MIHDQVNTFQDQLQKEAREILDKLDLLSILSKYGSPEIVGSMALGLMTRKDIDFEIISDDISRTDISEIIHILISRPFPRFDCTFMDNQNGSNSNLPKGIYLGIQLVNTNELVEKYQNNPDVWHIDCWFVTSDNAYSKKMTDVLKEKLTSEMKDIILNIKTELTQNPDYKTKYSGVDLYTAVLNHNIHNTQEFITFISNKSRN